MNTKPIYDPKTIEPKWQKWWLENKVYQPDLKAAKKPFYNLMMFPYPSAEGLHVGNMYAFTGADVHGRFKRMQGFDVFEPIGLDGFGIHSENYAIKVGRHPAEHAKVSEKHFYEQLHMIGNGFAWEQKLETYDPDYYRWTQWLFIEMYKHGLAYRKKAMVNWCPSCKTVLSDEQVEGGVCERCKTATERKETEQWFFKITEYAERLLDNIPKLNWPKKITVAQQNWIGKSKGLVIDFQIEGAAESLTVWTKFWETVFGTTFLVIAPDHPAVERLKIPSTYEKGVKSYVSEALKKTEQQRKAEDRKKTGVFTGIFVINPVNSERIPLWIADYVLMDVGTGVVMGVPAHDERDFEFARKHGLKIIQVVSYSDKKIDEKVKNSEMAYEGEGTLVNSGQFNGMSAWGVGKQKMAEWMIGKDWAKWQTTYHLRDWLISRQRYWGPPIPIIYCRQCWETRRAKHEIRNLRYGIDYAVFDTEEYMIHPVTEIDLPIKLPHIKDFQPRGSDYYSPLASHEEFYKVKCPVCGMKALRETDVSDTFLDSSWYFLAYPNLQTDEFKGTSFRAREASREIQRSDSYRPAAGGARSLDFARDDSGSPFNPELTKKWLPVDAYIGGAEHAVLHLLYSRFVWMALSDWGYLPKGEKEEGKRKKEEGNDTRWEEPFPFLFSHGLLIKDGAKMSKSRGNVVNPDEYIGRFGADALRMYLMFLGPYSQGGDFRDTGMAGMYRFLERIWNSFQKQIKNQKSKIKNPDKEILRLLNRTIKRVTEDMGKFKYNTAIAAMMEFMNGWEGRGREQRIENREQLSKEDAGMFVKLLAPLAPHVAEELWVSLGNKPSVHLAPWPKFDAKLAAAETVRIPVQINGKTRAVIEVETNKAGKQKLVEEIAGENSAVRRHLAGKKQKQVIFVPSKILNFVVE